MEITASGLSDSLARLVVLTESAGFMLTVPDADPSLWVLLHHSPEGTTVIPSGAAKSILSTEITLTKIASDSESTCAFSQLDLNVSDSLRLEAGPDGVIQFSNYGETIDCDVRLEIAQVGADTVFSARQVHFAENSAFRIWPDWRQSGDCLVIAVDSGFAGAFSDTLKIENQGESCRCGDADCSGSINISDAVYLLAYMFAGEVLPADYSEGDFNCSGACNMTDVVYLIAHIFGGGPAPCEYCP